MSIEQPANAAQPTGQTPGPQLNPREEALLPQAETFVKTFIAKHGNFPTRETLRRALACRDNIAGNLRGALIARGLVAVPESSVTESGDVYTTHTETKRELAEVNQHLDNDNVWNISLPKTDIHTLDQLLEYCKVDLKIWEVKEFVVNKWSMGFVTKAGKVEWQDDATLVPAPDVPDVKISKPGKKHSKKTFESGSQPLYQVKARLARIDQRPPDVLAEDNAKLLRRLSRVQTELSGAKTYQRHLAKGHVGADDLLASVKDFVNAFGDYQLPKNIVHPARPQSVPPVKGGHNEDAVLLWSDFHFGDVIRREDTSGFPEFDLTIAGNRFGYVVKKAKQILSLHRAMYPIKRLYVWFGGDIGNGVLHDSPNSNALFPPAQVHFSYHMLKFGLEDLLTLTEPDEETGAVAVEEIVLLFTVGNHMRMDEKMPHKYQAQRTLDWLIYQFLIERFGSHPKVRIRQEMSPYIFENIRGHRYLFSHGMQVGYRNSPDAQCKSMAQFIDRARSLFDSPEWRRKNNLQGASFDRVCIGDIHVPVSFPRLKSNGSLNGQNELGVNWTLEPIPAGQQIFGVADNHQETWQYFLDCSRIQRAKGDFNPYGIFAADYMKKIGRG